MCRGFIPSRDSAVTMPRFDSHSRKSVWRLFLFDKSVMRSVTWKRLTDQYERSLSCWGLPDCSRVGSAPTSTRSLKATLYLADRSICHALALCVLSFSATESVCTTLSVYTGPSTLNNQHAVHCAAALHRFMWHNDKLCRRAADEGSWAQRGPDCVKVHRLHVCLCLFSLLHYRTVRLCCVSVLSRRGKVTGRGHMSINRQLLDSCWRDKRRLDDCCRLRRVEKTLQTQKSENCQRMKHETCSKSHACVLITSWFECINAQSVFTLRTMQKCSLLFSYWKRSTRWVRNVLWWC